MPLQDGDPHGGDAVPSLSFDVFDEDPRSSQPVPKGKGGKGTGPRVMAKGQVPEIDPADFVEDDVGDGGQDFEMPNAGGKKGRGRGRGPKGQGKGPKGQLPEFLQKKQIQAMNKAQETLNKVKTETEDALIWNNNIRRRVIEAHLKSLVNANAGLLPLVEKYTPAGDLSSEITTFMDVLNTRFEVLTSFRTSPFQMLEPMDDKTFGALIQMQTSVLSTLVTHIATCALKGLEQDFGRVGRVDVDSK